MKILHIIPSLSKGGAERLVLTICNEMQKRDGLSVRVVTFSNKNEYPNVTQNITWDVVPSVYIPSLRGKAICNIDALQKYVSDYKPDIIHTHLWEAEIVSRQVNYPNAVWVSHFHDSMRQLSKLSFPISKIKITDFFERNLMIKLYKKYSNSFICISKDTKKYAMRNLPKLFHSRIFLLHNAIDNSIFKNKLSSTFQNNQISLITVGRLDDNKNQIFLLQVVKFLKELGYSVTLQIIGDGICKNLLESFCRENNLLNNVQFLGAVNNPEIYLWQSNIYVHAALSEGFGLTLVEAMAAGLPVVCLDGKGNRDLIEQGKNGYMIFEQNPDLFAEKILEIWNDKNLYKSMSEYAVEFAQKFDIVEYVNTLLEIYKQK